MREKVSPRQFVRLSLSRSRFYRLCLRLGEGGGGGGGGGEGRKREGGGIRREEGCMGVSVGVPYYAHAHGWVCACMRGACVCRGAVCVCEREIENLTVCDFDSVCVCMCVCVCV